MPDINEPTEAEIEAVKTDQQWWQQVEEPLGLRLGGWTFRKSAQFFDISTGAAIELPGSVAERVIAGRRFSSAPSFADGIEAAAKVADDAQKKWALGSRNLDAAPEMVGGAFLAAASVGAGDIAKAIRALSHNPQATGGGGRLNDQGHDLGTFSEAIAALTASNDRVAELERERDEAREERDEAYDGARQFRLRAEAAEAEVSRLKAAFRDISSFSPEPASHIGPFEQIARHARATTLAALSNQAGASK